MSKIIENIAELGKSRGAEIDEWFAENYALLPHGNSALFYNSVDIRRSQYKLAPVDSNLFPAGFNNLSAAALENGVKAARHFFAKHYPGAAKIILLPENHTRNLYYIENIIVLRTMLETAGMEVRVGNFFAGEGTVTLNSASGKELAVNFLQVENGKLMAGAEKFIPDLVIINNDFTSGLPEELKKISQPILPNPELGWHTRRKSKHFAAYDQVARKFCGHFGLDDFFITTIFRQCGTVNFREREGLECIALNVEKVIHTLKEKYKERGILDEPYVFIKSDKGTYGMGIMTAKSGDEVYEMGKKMRHKMNVIKGGELNDEVIIQEGIPTIDSIEGHPAEPIIYAIGCQPIGIFYRANVEKDEFGNLNSPGMKFYSEPDKAVEDLYPCGFKVFGLIARLATLAAAKEEY